MIFSEVMGWFEDMPFYDMMVQAAPEKAMFVEIGCWLGKSTTYLASRICGSMKDIRLCVYDTFEGSFNEQPMVSYAMRIDVEFHFVRNMRMCGFHIERLSKEAPDGWVDDSFMPRFLYAKALSTESAAFHPDKSVDFAFIDACHTYKSVWDDIHAWLPKIKPGGYIAGHDWNTYEGVQNAVSQSFGRNGKGFKTEGNCWYKRV